MKHVVLLSGGKDSTAMAIRLQEVEPREYTYLITPTGNELPEMEDHWKKLETILDSPLVRVGNRTLMGIIIEQNMIPNWRARFCTRMLKIEPYKAWLLDNMPVTGYVGLRADEGEREGIEWKEDEINDGLTTRYPLTEWGWGIKDVLTYLSEVGVAVPKRTDCSLCFFQRLGELWRLWRDYPEEWAKGELIEEKMGHTFRAESKDVNWPGSMQGLRKAFASGRVPMGADTMDDLFHERDRLAEAKCRMCSI